MCDPVSLTIVSIGTTLASTGLGVMGQTAMYGYQARVARNNQTAADRLAVAAEKHGRIAEDRQRLRTRALMGTQVAALVGQGARPCGLSDRNLG